MSEDVNCTCGFCREHHEKMAETPSEEEKTTQDLIDVLSRTPPWAPEEIQVIGWEDHLDGSATVTFDLPEKAIHQFAQIGLLETIKKAVERPSKI